MVDILLVGIIGLVACRRHDRTAVRDAYRSALPEDQRAMLAACRTEVLA